MSVIIDINKQSRRSNLKSIIVPLGSMRFKSCAPSISMKLSTILWCLSTVCPPHCGWCTLKSPTRMRWPFWERICGNHLSVPFSRLLWCGGGGLYTLCIQILPRPVSRLTEVMSPCDSSTIFSFSTCQSPGFYWYICMSCLCGHLERPSDRQGGWRSCFLSDDAMVPVKPLRGASVDLRLEGSGTALRFYSCWRCTVRLLGLMCPSLFHFAFSFIRWCLPCHSPGSKFVGYSCRACEQTFYTRNHKGAL